MGQMLPKPTSVCEEGVLQPVMDCVLKPVTRVNEGCHFVGTATFEESSEPSIEPGHSSTGNVNKGLIHQCDFLPGMGPPPIIRMNAQLTTFSSTQCK
jgi:hypothetical protein